MNQDNNLLLFMTIIFVVCFIQKEKCSTSSTISLLHYVNCTNTYTYTLPPPPSAPKDCELLV